MLPIAWHELERFPEHEVYCRCEVIYHSHVKGVMIDGHMLIVTRKMCPGCGRTTGNARRVSSPPKTVPTRYFHHDPTDPD